jgi:DNA-binding transcriptional regulator LsrR (DeoR family)
MANIELIRKLHFKEGRSIRQLSKDLKLSRQTIRKAVGSIPDYLMALVRQILRC